MSDFGQRPPKWHIKELDRLTVGDHSDLPRREFVPLGRSIKGFLEAADRARRELWAIPSLYP